MVETELVAGASEYAARGALQAERTSPSPKIHKLNARKAKQHDTRLSKANIFLRIVRVGAHADRKRKNGVPDPENWTVNYGFKSATQSIVSDWDPEVG